MLKSRMFYFKVSGMVTADGKKILSKVFFQASGTLHLLPDGSRCNDWWRGWEESAVIIVAFLITEQLYRSDRGVCREPHILLAWFIKRDSLVTEEGRRFNLQPFRVESSRAAKYNRVPFNDMQCQCTPQCTVVYCIVPSSLQVLLLPPIVQRQLEALKLCLWLKTSGTESNNPRKPESSRSVNS